MKQMPPVGSTGGCSHTEYRQLEAGHRPVLLLGGGQGQLGQDGEEEKEETEHDS